MQITAMPNASGTKSRTNRSGRNFPSVALSMAKRIATPEMKNSSASRHGLTSPIAGSTRCEA